MYPPVSAVVSSSAHPIRNTYSHSLRDRTRNVSPRNNNNVTLELTSELPKTRAYPSTRIATTLAPRWRAAHCCSSLSPDRSEPSLRSLSPPPLLPKASSITLRATPTGASSPHSSRCACYPHSFATLLSSCSAWQTSFTRVRARPCVQRCGVAVVRAGRTETSVVLLEREHTTVTRWKGKIKKKAAPRRRVRAEERERERARVRDSRVSPRFYAALHDEPAPWCPPPSRAGFVGADTMRRRAGDGVE